jgi:hypothetical protein
LGGAEAATSTVIRRTPFRVGVEWFGGSDMVRICSCRAGRDSTDMSMSTSPELITLNKMYAQAVCGVCLSSVAYLLPPSLTLSPRLFLKMLGTSRHVPFISTAQTNKFI